MYTGQELSNKFAAVDLMVSEPAISASSVVYGSLAEVFLLQMVLGERTNHSRDGGNVEMMRTKWAWIACKIEIRKVLWGPRQIVWEVAVFILMRMTVDYVWYLI